jgi:CheY-like chemotaxis protein
LQQAPFQIVIAEDNSADVMLVRQAIREHRIDCTIRVLHDGDQALTFLEEADNEPSDRRIDLLVLDLNLPKCDGQEVLEKLRSTKCYAETPVILMTAMDTASPGMKRTTEIASDCFPKPSTLDEFLNLGVIIRGLLETNRARSEGVNSSGEAEGAA